MADSKIHIIGMGDDGLQGLTSPARQLVEQADLLVGPDSALASIPPSKAERLVVGANLDETINRIARAGNRRVVVLASGDPLFYGVARYLCDKLGKERFEVVPHVSSMQLAFARVKESWEEAFLTNLANRPLEQVIEKIRVADKAGLFTSDASPPKAVARALLGSADRLFLGLRLRESGLARRARHAGGTGGNRPRRFLAAQRDDPGAEARRARPAQRGDWPSTVRQSRRSLPAIEAQAGIAHPG